MRPPIVPSGRIRRAGLLAAALLAAGAGCSGSSKSLYQVAAEGDSRKDALKLIHDGANVNEANPGNGWTPLHVAAANGHPKMCETLIENGANVNATDVNGMTPLHLAMARGHAKTAGILLAAGANPGIRNSDGKTPDDLAKD